MAAQQAAQLQQALIAHDRVRRTTDIPLFYGRKGKDTITPQQLVFRLEKASRVAGWDNLANPDQRKTDEFYLSLRDNALQWYNTLDNIIGFNKENWNDLKAKFLEAYAPKLSKGPLYLFPGPSTKIGGERAGFLQPCFRNLPQRL
jgi:hypothetical protein